MAKERDRDRSTRQQHSCASVRAERQRLGVIHIALRFHDKSKVSYSPVRSVLVPFGRRKTLVPFGKRKTLVPVWQKEDTVVSR